MMRVSSADFIKNYGKLADQALAEAITITRDGRDRLVLLSVEEYSRLRRRDRKVVATGDLSLEDLRLISEAEVPPGHDHLDRELKDWQP